MGALPLSRARACSFGRVAADDARTMNETIRVGDRVRILLDSESWKSRGWFEGRVVKIEPYSGHRSFYWVKLDRAVEANPKGTTNMLSIFNPKKIQRI